MQQNHIFIFLTKAGAVQRNFPFSFSLAHDNLIGENLHLHRCDLRVIADGNCLAPSAQIGNNRDHRRQRHADDAEKQRRCAGPREILKEEHRRQHRQHQDLNHSPEAGGLGHPAFFQGMEDLVRPERIAELYARLLFLINGGLLVGHQGGLAAVPLHGLILILFFLDGEHMLLFLFCLEGRLLLLLFRRVGALLSASRLRLQFTHVFSPFCGLPGRVY